MRILWGMEGVTNEDRALVDRVRAGGVDGRQAFGEVVDRYGERLASYLARMVGTHGPIADLTQETFLKAYRGLASYDDQRSFAGWLFGIATNLAHDHARRAAVRRTDPLPDRADDPERDPAGLAAGAERTQRVRRALLDLPEPQREVVLLHVYETMSYAEIGTALGIPEATARSRMRYALERLEASMGERVHG